MAHGDHQCWVPALPSHLGGPEYCPKRDQGVGTGSRQENPMAVRGKDSEERSVLPTQLLAGTVYFRI